MLIDVTRAPRKWHTSRDTLDTATAGKTTNGRLGDALDIVTKDFSVALGTIYSEALSTFAACEDC